MPLPELSRSTSGRLRWLGEFYSGVQLCEHVCDQGCSGCGWDVVKQRSGPLAVRHYSAGKDTQESESGGEPKLVFKCVGC